MPFLALVFDSHLEYQKPPKSPIGDLRGSCFCFTCSGLVNIHITSLQYFCEKIGGIVLLSIYHRKLRPLLSSIKALSNATTPSQNEQLYRLLLHNAYIDTLKYNFRQVTTLLKENNYQMVPRHNKPSSFPQSRLGVQSFPSAPTSLKRSPLQRPGYQLRVLTTSILHTTHVSRTF